MNKNSLIIIIAFIIISLEKRCLSQQYPYPIKLTNQNITSHVYPFYLNFQGNKAFLTGGGAYYLNETNFSISKQDEQFSLVLFHTNQVTDNYYTFATDNGHDKYVFPVITERMIYKVYREENEDYYDYCYRLYNTLESDSKVDDEKLDEHSVLFSFLRNNQSGVVIILDEILHYKESATITNEAISSHGFFSCKHFGTNYNDIFCVYANNSDSFYYMTFDRSNVAFSSSSFFYTLDSSESDTVQAIRIISLDSFGIGIAFASSNVYWIFKFDVAGTSLTMNMIQKTNMICADYITMNIKKVYDNFLLITGSDGSKTYCYFYDYDFNKIGDIDDKNICGYQEFRVSIIDNAFHFVYIKDTNNFFYYVSQEIFNCDDKTFEFSTNEPFVISLDELMSPYPMEYMNSKTGILLVQSDGNPLYGTFIEIDSDNNTVGNVIFNNPSSFYQKISYSPVNIGTNSFEYNIYIVITDEFYIPSPKCQITISNICYGSCSTCSTFGDENIHNCITCKSNFHFVDGTSNCYASPPQGYYLDQSDWKYKQCSSDCYSCENDLICLICNENFSLLSRYTLEESDSYCVTSCSFESRWFYNEDGDIGCTGKDECTTEYPCYNSERNECKKNKNDNDCEIILPSTLTIEDLFKYYDKNIFEYYKNNFVTSNDNYTTVVYDTSKTSNEAAGMKNLTEIDLGECEDKIREIYNLTENDKIIIAQIDTKKENTNSPNFAYYLENGTKLDFEICQNISITLSVPVKTDNLSLDSDYIQELLNQDIDVFDTNDDFFNDKCKTFTSVNDSDVAIKDRKEYYYQNVSLCGEGCEYSGIKSETFFAKCNCYFQKTGSGSVSMGEEVFDIFKSSLSEGNYIVIKCYNLVFNFDILVKNYGSYSMIALLIIQIVIFVVYLVLRKKIFKQFCGNEEQIKTIIDEKGNLKSTQVDEKKNKIQDTKSINLHTIDYSSTSIDKSFIHKQFQDFLAKGKPYYKKTIKYPNKITIYHPPTIIPNYDKLTFNEAIKLDKRGWFSMYFSMLKTFHPIYSCFIDKEPDKIRLILISDFIFGISTDIAFNAIFYSDNYISNTYHSGYDFLYEIPKSIFSSLSASLVTFFLGLLTIDFPDEDDIKVEIEKNKNLKYKEEISHKIATFNIVYFIFILVLTLFCWYYVAAFCAVYQNSQNSFLYGCLTSFILSMLFPFLTAIECVALRKISFCLNSELFFHAEKFIEAY